MAITDRPLLGCIRWDALSECCDFERKTLSPLKWHDRVPFFLSIDAEDNVSGHENTQEIIDKQIICAKEAGIDYWAFISSPETNPGEMEVYALRKYLASEYKSQLGFSVILHKYNPSEDEWRRRAQQAVSWFKEPSYVKVLNNRPLVYIFAADELEEAYGEGRGAQKALDYLRDETVKAGFNPPYIVAMGQGGLEKAKAGIERYRLDALSGYIYIHEGYDRVGLPFEELANKNIAGWDDYKACFPKIIPCVTLGFDQRCRWENPPPWGAFDACYYEQGAPEQIAELIKKSLLYTAQNRSCCEANSVLVYAWNEFCEGGWLCPTHAQGTRRLDAIKKMLSESLF